MTQPDTCSAAGGAISLWLKVNECPDGAGIFTTTQYEKSTGSFIVCKHDKFGKMFQITGISNTFFVAKSLIQAHDGLLVTSALGFKARVNQIHLSYETC